MKDGIGEGFTRADHQDVANQLFSCYAKVGDARALASVIGEDELSPLDKTYLKFGKAFEADFVGQGEDENRSIIETLDKGWELLGLLPRERTRPYRYQRSWTSITEKPSDSEVILWIRIPSHQGKSDTCKNSLALSRQGYELMDKKAKYPDP